MAKTVVLYARICPQESIHTKHLFQSFQKHTDFECVFIDASKPFDVAKEQEYILGFDNIILLFTMNWYNIPWSLSRYFAEVWRTFPFSLENKNVYKVVTTGSNKEHYSKTGEKATGWLPTEFLNNVNGMLKKLRANQKEEFFYHNCVEVNEQKLQAFSDQVITFFKDVK
ncbi:NAD(P)H-dependent oxidoreductase [Ureaplasma diversum]|uniref:Putative tRNA/rRNA methyltransferase n=1 Tax=Ureaplasma diversum NCTC 246 TaxID=1188241 RepID=A0A084EWT3_9BACT|nr:NAD(P)H-dependent oxidoreductase [Ureaplasma diversum]KEZ22425.1 putative tRNA/rRNA methyltransferase [Ureaplasma diversum NCTC 246]